MIQYYVIDAVSREVHSEHKSLVSAEEVCSKLNRDLPYVANEYYIILNEADYKYMTGEEDKICPIYSVYGVGKKSDAYPPMDDLVIAGSPSEARKQFEKKHPNYRAVDAYQVG